jgi:hypothetical protein
VLRIATLGLALGLLLVAPAASGPTYHYRVTGGTMLIETREATGFERLSWSVAPHTRGTRPVSGFSRADGSGGLKTFQVRYPVRGTYTYDYDEEDSGACRETFAFTAASRGTASSRQVGTRVRISWGLNPRRRAGYVPHQCRPPTNNALLYFLANQPTTVITLPAGGIEKKLFRISARGSQTGDDSTLTWRLSLSVERLGVRR